MGIANLSEADEGGPHAVYHILNMSTIFRRVKIKQQQQKKTTLFFHYIVLVYWLQLFALFCPLRSYINTTNKVEVIIPISFAMYMSCISTSSS